MDWQEALSAIGDGAKDDYILNVGAHRDALQGKADALLPILSLAGTQQAAESYQLFDQSAIEAQTSYKTWMRRANVAALLTAVFGAAAMAWALIEVFDSGPLKYGHIALNIVAVASASVGAAALYFLRSGKLLENWMNKRAHAETLRLGYFSDIVQRAPEYGRDAAMLALEYFRRYQLDAQKAFFFSRARTHESSANKTTAIGAIGAGIAALSSVAGLGAGDSWSAVGVFTVFGAALGSFAIGREQMTQDRRNAERYDRTYAALAEITKTLDDVRPAVAAGQFRPMQEFATAVNENISNEHRQWLDQAEATQAAMQRIEEALKTGEDEAETARD